MVTIGCRVFLPLTAIYLSVLDALCAVLGLMLGVCHALRCQVFAYEGRPSPCDRLLLLLLLPCCQVQRALYQCREQSWHMLEQACFAVERAAEGGGVFPEVLFDVARHWYGMAEEVGVAGSVVGVVLPNGSGSSDVTCRRYEPRSPNAAGAGTLTQVRLMLILFFGFLSS